MPLSEINYLAILIASVAAFVIGYFWYGPVFGTTWQNETNLTDAEIQDSHPGKVFGSAFVLTALMTIMLAHLITDHYPGWIGGMHLGLEISVGFVATAIGVNYLFAQKSFKLWMIDAGYNIVCLSLAGAIIGAMS